MTDQQHADLLALLARLDGLSAVVTRFHARLDGLSAVVTRFHARLGRIEQQLGINPAGFPRLVHAPDAADDAPGKAFIVIGNLHRWHDDLAPYVDKYVDVREHPKAWTIRPAGSERVIATIPKDLPAPKLKTIPPKTNCCSIQAPVAATVPVAGPPNPKDADQ